MAGVVEDAIAEVQPPRVVAAVLNRNPVRRFRHRQLNTSYSSVGVGEDRDACFLQ